MFPVIVLQGDLWKCESMELMLIFIVLIKRTYSHKHHFFPCQGIKHVDHFGFICRESPEPGLSQYICYVFQCASESLVSGVIVSAQNSG